MEGRSRYSTVRLTGVPNGESGENREEEINEEIFQGWKRCESLLIAEVRGVQSKIHDKRFTLEIHQSNISEL